METRTIVVKNIEIGPGSGAGTGGGTGGGGGGRNPLAGLVRLVFRVVLVVLACLMVITYAPAISLTLRDLVYR